MKCGYWHVYLLQTVVTCLSGRTSQLTIQEDCTAGILIQCLRGLNQSFPCVEASEDLLQACMPDSVKRLLEIYDVVGQIAQVLQVLLYDDASLTCAQM